MRKLSREQKYVRRRILEISHEKNFSHLGSNLSVVDIILAVYDSKSQEDRFVLSSGHGGFAFYVVLEAKKYISPSLTSSFNIHPDRNIEHGIYVSTGSLGQGLPIALGMAMADQERIVYCVLTDGECAEGSVWEALRVAMEYKVTNLKMIVSANGWGAYDPIDISSLLKRFRGFGYRPLLVDGHNIEKLRRALKKKIKDSPLLVVARTSVEQFFFLKGQDAHYYVMNDTDYKMALEMLR